MVRERERELVFRFMHFFLMFATYIRFLERKWFEKVKKRGKKTINLGKRREEEAGKTN